MDIVYTVVLPLASIVIFAMLGFMRGARREAYVSGAIALGALLVLEWGERWGRDVTTFISGLSAGDAVFYVTVAILALSVLVIGYGLGSSAVRGAPDGTSRALGLVLGALNGAAFAGYLLRIAFVHLEQSSGTSPVYTNPVSYWLVFWAGWFPVALAALGAVVALVRAFAGDDEKKVPAPQTTPALAEPAPVGVGTYTGYQGAPPAAGSTVVPSGPTAPTTAYVPPPAPPVSSPQAGSTDYTNAPPAQSGYGYAPPDEEWRTTAPDLAANKAIAGQASGSDSATEAKAASDTGIPTPMTTLPIGDEKYYTPPFGSPAVTGEGEANAPVVSTSPSSESSGVKSTETVSMPVVTRGEGEKGENDTGSALKCRTCGAALSPGQLYCTECGTKVES